MIPYDVDPSLHNTDPKPEQLDDGFSPPQCHPPAQEADDGRASADVPVDPSLWTKSPF